MNTSDIWHCLLALAALALVGVTTALHVVPGSDVAWVIATVLGASAVKVGVNAGRNTPAPPPVVAPPVQPDPHTRHPVPVVTPPDPNTLQVS